LEIVFFIFGKMCGFNLLKDYHKYGNEMITLESCLLQTLGFNVLINHAHTVIIKTCQMIKAPRDLAEAAYLTATNSLILTNFCVKFPPEKVACFCIYLACKWTGIKVKENKSICSIAQQKKSPNELNLTFRSD